MNVTTKTTRKKMLDIFVLTINAHFNPFWNGWRDIVWCWKKRNDSDTCKLKKKIRIEQKHLGKSASEHFYVNKFCIQHWLRNMFFFQTAKFIVDVDIQCIFYRNEKKNTFSTRNQYVHWVNFVSNIYLKCTKLVLTYT